MITGDQKLDAENTLRELLRPNDEIWGLVRYHSKGNTKQYIQLIKFENSEYDGKIRPVMLGLWVSRLLGIEYHRGYEGVAVSGSGMNLGVALTQRLGTAMYPVLSRDGPVFNYRNL